MTETPIEMFPEVLMSELEETTSHIEWLEEALAAYRHKQDILIVLSLDSPEITGREVAQAADMTEGRMYARARRQRSLTTPENLRRKSIQGMQTITADRLNSATTHTGIWAAFPLRDEE